MNLSGIEAEVLR